MKIMQYVPILSHIPLFYNFTNSMFVDFFEEIPYRISHHEKDEIIFLEGEVCDGLKVVVSGVVQIQKIDSFGKVLTIVEFCTGETLGDNLIFGDVCQFPMTVSAKNKVTIFHIPKDAIIQLCQKDATFLLQFLRMISNKSFTLTTKLKEITLKTIRQKICEFLLWQYSKQQKMEIALDMTKKEWAEKMGVQRPSLSRELIQMKKDGWIDFDKHRVVIKDLQRIKNCVL